MVEDALIGAEESDHPEPRSELARVLLDRVRVAADDGKPALAVKLARRGLHALSNTAGKGELRAQLTVNLALNLAEIGKLETVPGLLDDAEQIHPASAAVVQTARGIVMLRAGQQGPALAALCDAIDGAIRAEGRTLMAALFHRALLHMTAGQLTKAAADTERAIDVACLAGYETGASMARYNLGYIRFLSGDLPAALAEMDRAVADLPPSYVGMPSLDRARVLQSAGLISDSREAIQLAIAEFTANRATADLADSLLVGAEIDILLLDSGAAASKARRAAKIYLQRDNDNSGLIARLVEIRALSLRSRSVRRPRSVNRIARDAAELAPRLAAAGLPEDASAASLLAAEALLDGGDERGAELAIGSLSGSGRNRTLGNRLHFALVAARLDLGAGHRSSGFAHIRKGLDDLADFQARFGSQDMQAGAAVHGAALARLGLRTAVAGGSPAAILQWLERSRAVTTRLPAVHPPADRELAETLGQLRLATIDARAAVVAGHRDPALEKRVGDLRRHVRARSWTVSGSGTVQRPLTLTAVQRLLAGHPSDPTVIALLHGDVEVHALVITAHRATHHRLEDWPDVHGRIRRIAADLDLLAAPRIPSPVMRAAGYSLTGDLTRLDRDLVERMLPEVTGGPVIIAAVGPMATLPWGLLPSLAGRPVSVSSSVTAAMSYTGRPSRAYLRGVLAVAGPDVPGGADEAAAVAGMHAGAHLLVGADATGEAVLGQMPSGGLLHVAAHGHHEPDSPLFSSVQLADGPLYGYDIAPNAALPDHVVLSSCDVGRSDDRPGGEPLGLAAALLRSGVSTVIAGISRISDEVAATTMVVYHERLLAGDGPAVALATAIGTAEGGPPAPLTCFGAGS